MDGVAAANTESSEAWNGPLFERFREFRPFISAGLGPHGEVALAAHPPRPGDRVLDIGCGFGDTSRRLAGIVGEAGEVVGVDVSAPFLEVAREEAAAAAIANLTYRVGDAQVADLGGPYDYVFSRMGVMFFADPVGAMRNVRGAMRAGGRVCFVVWRRKLDNGWVHAAEQVVERHLEPPADLDPDAPGPFSMADADLLSGNLRAAGFGSIELLRSDLPMPMGPDLDAAVEAAMGIGPVGEALRLAGDSAAAVRPQIAAEVRAALAQFETADGVLAPASSWIVSALA